MDNNELSGGHKYVNPNKKYGLIIPSKTGGGLNKLVANRQANQVKVKPCIFGDEDEDDEDEIKDSKKSITSAKQSSINLGSNKIKKQTQIEIEKALSEDPTVFEYDNIYDKLEEEKNKIDPKQKAKNESKEPKYIAGIMKEAAKRQMEFEKRQERKIQKEREEEGDLWNDKEVFVTSAYRKKIEERQMLEEEERRQEKIEQLLDVTKAKDLSGIHSFILKLKSGEAVIEEESEKEKRELREKKEAESKEIRHKSHQNKHYRAKQEESSDESDNEELKDKENKQEDEIKEEKTSPKPNTEVKETKIDENSEEPSNKRIKLEDETKKEEEPVIRTVEEIKLSKEQEKELRRQKLFTKRTVGDKFDEELMEYFVRRDQYLSTKAYIERD